MKTAGLFPLLLCTSMFVTVAGCDEDDGRCDGDSHVRGMVEINDIVCSAGGYGGDSGWDADRQVFVLPLTYRFTHGGNVTDGYFTFVFTGGMPDVGDNLAHGRGLALSTDGLNRLPYRSGDMLVRAVDLASSSVTVEYDDLKMGAAVPDLSSGFNRAGSYEIDGWQTVPFDIASVPGTM